MELRKRAPRTTVYNLKQKYGLGGCVCAFFFFFLSILYFSNETVRNVQSYVIISDSSWQLGREALERISLSQSKIKFGLKHRAHLGSN